MINILNIYDKIISLITIDKSGNITQQKELNVDKYFLTFSELKNSTFPETKFDIVIFWHPEYYFVPIGIEKNTFTIACIGDWNINFINLQSSLKHFHQIITDYRGVKAFAKYGFNNLSYFPIFSLRIPDYSNVKGIEKIYDILFIGNLNQDVQTDRNQYLYRIARLSDKYNILITGGIYGEEYKKLIAQSKIIFNRSVRGELNARVYEAMAAGSLFFLEEENEEYKFYLNPGKEFVAYNSENLESLLEYYLNNEKANQKIVANADRFFSQNSTKKFHHYLYKHILSLYISSEKKEIFFTDSDKTEIYYTEALTSIDKSILKSLNRYFPFISEDKPYYANLNLLIFLESEANIKKKHELFKEYLNKYPNYFPLKMNYLYFVLDIKKLYFLAQRDFYNEIKVFLENNIQLLMKDNFSINDFKGVFLEKYTRFHSQYEKIFSEYSDDILINKLKELFLWKMYSELAKLQLKTKDTEPALQNYLNAENLLSSSIIKNHIGNIYENTGNLEKALEYYNNSFKEDIFNFNNFYALISLQKILYEKIPYEQSEWMSIIDSSPLFQEIIQRIDKDDYLNYKLFLLNENACNQKAINIIADKILKIDPLNYQALIIKGNYYYNNREFKKALEIFSQLLTIKKEKKVILLIISCLKELGDTNTVKKLMEIDI